MGRRDHRIALIGAGRIAAVHLGYARSLPGARIVAVCDAEAERAEVFARERGVPAAYADVGEMLRREEPTTVHVVTPPTTHARLAQAAMEAGANVLVEKPMAMTVDEAERMIAVATRNGRRLCVDHNRLFDPVVLRARGLVDSGAIGEVVSVEAHQGVNLADGGGAPASRHWSVADPFAPLYNLGPHPLYLTEAFAGAFDDIALRGRRSGPGESLFGEIRAILTGSGADGHVVLSVSAQPYLNHLTILGTKGTLRANLNTMTLVVERVRRLPKLVAKLAANLEPAGQMIGATAANVAAVALRRMRLYPGIGETIRRFYRSLEEGSPPPVDPRSGLAVVRFLNAIEGGLRPPQPEAAAEERGNGSAPEVGWTS